MKKLYSSVLRSMMGKYVFYLSQLISLAVMSRTFNAAELGFYAALNSLMIFFYVIADFGSTPILVGKSDVSVYNKVLTNGSILSLLLSVLLFFALPDIGDSLYSIDFYNVSWVAISIFFCFLSMVFTSRLQEKTRFGLIAISDALAEVISLIVLYGLNDIYGFQIALAAKALSFFVVKAMVLVVLNAKYGGWVPKFQRGGGVLLEGRHQIGFNMVNYFSRVFDNILVGRYLGLESLGVYEKTYQIIRFPLLLVSLALAPAIQPIMKELKSDLGRFESVFREFSLHLSWVAALAAIGVYFSSELIVRVLLGPGWDEVATLLEILCFSVPAQLAISSFGGFYQSLDKTSHLFVSGLIMCVLVLSSLIVSLVFFESLSSISWSLVLAFNLSFYVFSFVFFVFTLKKGVLGFFSMLKELYLLSLVSPLVAVWAFLHG